jgi:hypothetical protein
LKKKRKDLTKTEVTEPVMKSGKDGSLIARWYHDPIRIRGIGTVKEQAIRGKRIGRRGVDKRRADGRVRWEISQWSKK